MKRFFTLCLAVCALALAVVSASLAYFTDSVATDNVVISGNIHVLQHEQERVRNEDGSYSDELTDFSQYQLMAPLVQSGPEGYQELPAGEDSFRMRDESACNYIDKIVTVQNVGVNPAYLRTFIAVPTGGFVSSSPDGDNWLRWDANTDSDKWNWSGSPDGTGWQLIDDALIGGVPYDIYVATYTEKLAPMESTPPSLLGFYLDSRMSCTETNYCYTTSAGNKVVLDQLPSLEILVATQSVQTTTFEDPWTALDTTFGPVGPNNHPWENEKTRFIRSNQELQEILSDRAAYVGWTLRLSSGTYTLPEHLPASIRIVGHGEVFIECAGTLQAAGVDLYHLTFTNDVDFHGSGEFDQIVFEGAFRAAFNNPAYLVDCTFSSAPEWHITEDAVRGEVLEENNTILSE